MGNSALLAFSIKQQLSPHSPMSGSFLKVVLKYGKVKWIDHSVDGQGLGPKPLGC